MANTYGDIAARAKDDGGVAAPAPQLCRKCGKPAVRFGRCIDCLNKAAVEAGEEKL